jgi:serine/alanine adding enzyme
MPDDATLAIERITAASAAEWDNYVQNHQQSTTYHRYAWRTIFGDAFGYRSFYVVVRDAQKDIVGCLPLFLVASPFGRRLVAVPFRDRGGILWNSEPAFESLIREAERIAAETHASFVELKSTGDYPATLEEILGLRKHLYWIRSVVPLLTLDADALWKRIGPKTRNMIRQAEQSALEFRDLTDDSGGAAAWYTLHLTTQKRQGLPPFPLRFFRSMIEMLRAESGVRLFGVFHGPKLIAATIVLLHRGTAIYGYSASSKAAQQFRPNDFMLFHVMKWLLSNRYEEFDLGSDAPSQDSLLFFKRKWLAEQTPAPVYVLGSADFSLSDSSHARYRIIRRAFQYIPTPLLRAIGNFATRMFG